MKKLKKVFFIWENNQIFPFSYFIDLRERWKDFSQNNNVPTDSRKISHVISQGMSNSNTEC